MKRDLHAEEAYFPISSCISIRVCRGYCATAQASLDWFEVQSGEDP